MTDGKTEIEFAGVKFRGGKIFIIITALTTLGGGLYAGFEFYKDYMNMRVKIEKYTAPDLSGIRKELAILDKKMDNVVMSVTEGVDYTRDIKVRKMVSDATDRFDKRREQTRNDMDSLEQRNKTEMKQLKSDIYNKIKKALENPLANMRK